VLKSVSAPRSAATSAARSPNWSGAASIGDPGGAGERLSVRTGRPSASKRSATARPV
jgi:hypothetical protein